jgi:hypothetical protein
MTDEEKVYKSDEPAQDVSLMGRSSGLTLRGILIAIIVFAFIGWITVKAHWFSTVTPINAWDAPSPLGLTVLIIIFALNDLFKRLKMTNSFFKGAESIFIYAMIMMGAMIMTRGVMLYLPSAIMALGRGKWISPNIWLNPYYERASAWIFPKSQEAVVSFYQSDASVPWGEWIMPIISWTIFITALALTLWCLLTLVRKRWIEVEQLQYNLTNPVLSIIEDKEEISTLQKIFKNKSLIIGLIIAVIWRFFNGVHNYFPAFPEVNGVNITFHEFTENQTPLWWAFVNYPSVTFTLNSPLFIGIGYLMYTQLSFSVWFCYIIYRLLLFPWFFGGHTQAELRPIVWTMNIWTKLAMSLGLLWVMRREIKDMFIAAFIRKEKEVDDSDEPISYRMAFIGFFLGFAFLVAFSCIFLFSSLWYAIYYIGAMLLLMLTIARIRAEAGLPFNQHLGDTFDRGTLELLPATWFGESNSLYMGLMYWPFTLSSFGAIGSIASESQYMSYKRGLNQRKMTIALVIALVLGLLLAWLFYLPDLYKMGVSNGNGTANGDGYLSGWVTSYYFSFMRTEKSIPKFLIASLGLGFGGVYLFTALYRFFPWWPIHPMGYILAVFNPVAWGVWSHIFVAWFIKFTVGRYGGKKLVERLTPFFFGLILGDSLMSAFWGLVGLIMR